MIVITRLSKDKTRRIPGVEPELYEALGELSATFAMLENTLKSVISFILRYNGVFNDALITILTSELSFRRHVDLIRCMCNSSTKDDDVDQLLGLCSRALKLEQERNILTHSYWGSNSDKHPVRLKTTAKSKGIVHQNEPINKQQIIDVCHSMGFLAKELENWVDNAERTPEQQIEYFRDCIDDLKAQIKQYENEIRIKSIET